MYLYRSGIGSRCPVLVSYYKLRPKMLDSLHSLGCELEPVWLPLFYLFLAFPDINFWLL